MTRPPVHRSPDRQDTTSLRVEPSRQQGIKTVQCHRRNTQAGREERDRPTPTQPPTERRDASNEHWVRGKRDTLLIVDIYHHSILNRDPETLEEPHHPHRFLRNLAKSASVNESTTQGFLLDFRLTVQRPVLLRANADRRENCPSQRLCNPRLTAGCHQA